MLLFIPSAPHHPEEWPQHVKKMCPLSQNLACPFPARRPKLNEVAARSLKASEHATPAA